MNPPQDQFGLGYSRGIILFANSGRWEGNLVLVNGGVAHVDGDGKVRWHPPQRVDMVIFEDES